MKHVLRWQSICKDWCNWAWHKLQANLLRGCISESASDINRNTSGTPIMDITAYSNIRKRTGTTTTSTYLMIIVSSSKSVLWETRHGVHLSTSEVYAWLWCSFVCYPTKFSWFYRPRIYLYSFRSDKGIIKLRRRISFHVVSFNFATRNV